MEASLPVVMSAVGTLLPLAAYAGRSCLSKIRDAKKIKKQILLMPPGSGKSWITKQLAYQRQFLVVDLDETMRSICDPKDIRHMDESKISGYNHEADLTYTELALEVLAKTQKRLRADKSLKVLFITSCWRFASHFKKESIYSVCPNKEAFEEHTMEKPVEERERLRKERVVFINSIPAMTSIHSYKTLEELEVAVRSRLGINNVL